MSIWIQPDKIKLDLELFRKLCPDLTEDYGAADVCVAYVTPPPGVPYERVIMLQAEPPVSEARKRLYSDAGKFLAWATFNPVTANALPFSETAPHLYPYLPRMELRVTRPDADLQPRGRGVYFAGHVPVGRPDTSQHGGQIIYQRRARWAMELVRAMGGRCVGDGWAETTKTHPEGWGVSKFADLAAGDFDFHFCAENCILQGYVSEKFWHGLLSDRVIVYIGHPGIKALVDPAAYVYADDFGTPAELIRYLRSMTPAQYHAIIMAARAVLDGLGPEPGWKELRTMTWIVAQIAQYWRK